MVVRRTIENLRERPKDERTALAASIALGVVAILFVGWVVYFFHSIATLPPVNSENTNNPLDSSGLQQAQQQLQQEYASTTTQFIDVEGNVETQQLGTSSQPSQ